MRIAVRIDDITPGMDWEKFYTFCEMLEENDIKPLLGVVPDNKDENLECAQKRDDEEKFWERIRSLQQQGYTMAMHGCNHTYSSYKGGIFPLNDFSEFAGCSYEEQKRKLTQGKEILEKHQIFTDVFMAPAHSFDENTLKILRELDFSKITDGYGNRPYIKQNITFYPISFYKKLSLWKRKGSTTLVVHTNTLTKVDMLEWKNILKDKKRTSWISFSELMDEIPKKQTKKQQRIEKILVVIKKKMSKMKR